MIKDIIQNVYSKCPLVHNITNYVAATDCANITLTIGASPIMADEPKEVGEVTQIADGLVLNCGTISESRLNAMLISGKTAKSREIPIVLDPVAGAFTGGQGDYVTLFEPTATEVERAGHGYILCSIGEESGEIPYTAYFASQSYMTAHPEVIQGFANAIARAQQWIVDHTDREVAEAIIDQFPDTDLDTLEAVTARHRQIDAWNAGPMMARSALERLETVMTEAGELEKDQWVDFDKLVDNSFAQKAMEAQ